MITLKLTPEGDIDVTGNTFSIIRDDEELVQKLRNILSIKRGEWFLNANIGLNHDNILGKSFDPEAIRLDVIEALNQDERVLQVEDITVDFDTVERITAITFKVTTTQDTVEGEVRI